MFINDALAQTSATAAQQGSVFATVVQLALIFLIFYLLLIRPQQKRIKQHEALLAAIKKGDQVITGGGIFAKVIDSQIIAIDMQRNSLSRFILYALTSFSPVRHRKAGIMNADNPKHLEIKK